jgi:hypothetical protein
MAIERKPLKKAPARDVVEAFTANAETPQAAVPLTESSSKVASRGPGRPRSKRRMEPFSSKIEMGLRDEVDAYLAENGGTIIDFLDGALRDRLAR